MNMRSTMNILATLLLLGAVGMASAQNNPPEVATLEKAEGTVMVDSGKGYATYKIKAKLREGDRLITLANSIAEIVFDDGCRLTLKENSLVEISEDPGCKAIIAALDPVTVAAPVATASSSIGPVLLGIGAVIHIAGNDDEPISGQ